MSIVYVIVVIAVVGLIAWALLRFVPMPPPLQNVLVAVVALALILWVLHVFGLLGAAAVRVP